MKRKKIGLYDPYLDTIGGGEKHILAVLQVLEQKANYQPVIFWDTDLSKEITSRLNIEFSSITFEKNIFKHDGLLTKLSTLKEYDIFIYVTDGSYFFSSAKKNFIFCMVPDKHLFAGTALNSLKTINFSFITNSQFTQKWLAKWNISAEVLYPYISSEYIELSNEPLKKEKIILLTGRFFRHLHSKRQDVAIDAFKKLIQNETFADYTLVLAGSIQESDKEYLEYIQSLASGLPVQIKTNISYTELLDLYKRAEYYWHFTGYNVDEEINPEKVEHLGITPLEAMAAGCIVFCYEAGGPKEIIKDSENGFLFNSIDMLIVKMNALSDLHKKQLVLNAQNVVKNNFSYNHFEKKVLQLFNDL